MSESHSTSVATQAGWGGGVSPYGVGYKKLGMWLFIVSDALTFSALIVAYSYVRIANDWPTPFEFYPAIIFSSVMTLVLLSSSLTMVFAVDAGHKGDRAAAAKWIWATALGGVIFIVLHVREWLHLIHDGVTPTGNPFGTPLFGGTFFTITGLHMTHVAIGVIYLAIVAMGFKSGKYDSEDVEVSGLYWHFVDLVWMFVFPMVYLMSTKVS
ncbi:MAG: cytochrome c oxidase subunit 3 [Acidobacteria bacterium]|nr:cytochrome c oxidase subunit 3 [Acidobacteriota bacterium]